MGSTPINPIKSQDSPNRGQDAVKHAPRPLRVLLVEDSQHDALILLHHLQTGGFAPEHRRVETAERFRDALTRETWELILCDYKMPGFSAPEALRIYQQQDLDMPFLVISGAVGDDVAVETMRLGAHDYVPKDHLARLAVAVERELRQAEMRRERRQALDALKEMNEELERRVEHRTTDLAQSEERLRLALGSAYTGAWDWDIPSGTVVWSPENFELYGLDPALDSPSFANWERHVHPDDLDSTHQAVQAALERRLPEYRAEFRVLHPRCGLRWVLGVGRVEFADDGAPRRMSGINIDITERKLMERQLTFYKNLMENSQEPFHVLDPRDGFRFIYVNPAACLHFGWPREKLLTMRVPDWDPIYSLEICEELWRRVKTEGSCIIETIHRHADGREIPVEVSVNCIEHEGQDYVGGFIHDISARKRAEEALRESEDRLRSFLENSATVAWLKDEGGHYVFLSGNGEKHFGASLETRLGKTDFELWPREIAEELRRNDQAVLDAGKTVEILERTTAPGGGTTWWQTNKFTFRGASGKRYVGGLGVDITARMQAEEALRRALLEAERFRNAVENVPVYVYMKDLQSRYLYGNRPTLELFGCSAEEQVGSDDSRFFPPETAKRLRGIDLRVFAGERTSEEITVEDGGGGERVYLEVKTPIYADTDGKTICGLLGVSTDITERKQAEAALRAANAALTEAGHRKDEFLAMLAHELRNPLAPVRNAVHILRAIGSKDPAALRQKDIIDRQVTHMARLLDDLLDVSRVTRGKIALQTQPLHLTDVLAHAVETATPLAQARRHTLHYTPPPDTLRIEGDLDRLTQVVGNLLVNAIKYTNEGGQIWLEAGGVAGQAVIRVRDNGIGIAPEMLPHIFELFTQADQSQGRAQGGLGIGLTMVQSLVQMHGGTVEAHSGGRDQGSEFIVRLPLLPEELAELVRQTQEARLEERAPSWRVLVVDDVADSAQSLAELLQLWGHTVRVAFDGRSALELAQTFQPEVVLLDIGMPGMDGYEVARRLRGAYSDQNMRLVAMTGYGQTHDREATREAGFNTHLVKPVDLERLRRLLHEVPGA